MPGILPHLLCAALYGLLAFAIYRSLVASPDDRTQLGPLHWAIAVPLLLHTWLLSRSVFIGGGMYLGVGNSISAIIWLTVLIYWLGTFRYRLRSLQVFVLGTAALAVLLPLVLPSTHPLPHTDFIAFRLHLLISMLAFSLLTIASLQAFLMALLERRLHAGALPPYLRTLPPLLSMEGLLFQIILAGFVLLTLTLGSGMLFSEELFGRPLRFSHKVVFALLAWIIFAALLGGRRIYGWRGRTALRWTLAGFMALVLAYIGSKFVLEVLLGF
ncbi:MAG: cytochrome c biogenesis protein CcsA [Burkholderiales bacterium]|nr:cytochrome c biogenesis protein CcsA [Burkholderiales bacterium]